MTQPDFNTAFADFMAQLAREQPNDPVRYETGRKFNKIIIRIGVRYFVEKSTGNIYGAKSYLAPNLNHYFGTVYNASKWNWAGFHGVNINDDTVRLVGAYGPYQHYFPVD